MELMDAIETCWAVRRFTSEPVTEEEITTCLQAATRAPSGGNIQPWQFVVVTDPELKGRIGEIYRRAYTRYEPALLAARRPYRDQAVEAAFVRNTDAARHLAEHLHEAPALVLFLMPDISLTLSDEQGELDVGTLYASVYPAVQNFLLAARGLGIGTTLTTVFRIYGAEVRELCSIPEGFEIVALVPMGRPQGGFGHGLRRPVAKVTHWNRFGQRRETAN